MSKDPNTTPHEKSDHELANSPDQVEIGTTAHTKHRQPVGHSLDPTHTNMNGSDADDADNHKRK
ncbi:hypothetical protein [Stutzerimonas marianensis]